MRIGFVLLLVELLAVPSVAWAESGIASQYPGHVGIQNDARVLKTENFEIGNLEALRTRWTDVKNLAGMSLISDRPAVSTGTRALRMTAVGGSNTGGHLYAPLSRGQNRIFVRYYVKYESGHRYGHSGGWVGGYNPVTTWPQGGAGIRPVGNERFSVSSEPVTPDQRYDFYAYWMRMRGAGGAFWGTDLIKNDSL